MGLFARLLQPVATGRYCLPYAGNNLMMEHVLRTSTDFVKSLSGSASVEKRLGVVMGILAVTVFYMQDMFKNSSQEVYDFTPVTDDLFNMSRSLSFSAQKMLWHPDQASYLKNNMDEIKPEVLAKLGNVAPTLLIFEFNKNVFSGALRVKNIDGMSMKFTNEAICFILSCARDDSDDFLLLQQLGSTLNSHFLTLTIVLKEIQKRNGGEKPIRI